MRNLIVRYSPLTERDFDPGLLEFYKLEGCLTFRDLFDQVSEDGLSYDERFNSLTGCWTIGGHSVSYYVNDVTKIIRFGTPHSIQILHNGPFPFFHDCRLPNIGDVYIVDKTQESPIIQTISAITFKDKHTLNPEEIKVMLGNTELTWAEIINGSYYLKEKPMYNEFTGKDATLNDHDQLQHKIFLKQLFF